LNKIPANILVFEEYSQQYDKWFNRHKWIYKSEIEALRKLVPQGCIGLEIGVGTGRFSTPFGINIGVDPSIKMGSIAKEKRIDVICAVGEYLPFKGEIFNFVLIVTTICFLEDPFKTLKEIKMVLKDWGSVVIGFIDKNSKLGKLYESRKEEKIFYKAAKFYSVKDLKKWLDKLSFTNFSFYQTIFNELNKINIIESIKEGYGEGSFIVLKAEKLPSRQS
jgi:ubiquinone/menaquinone biosynthesis C-methylase UbiE